MGDFEARALALVESSVKYHPCVTSALTAVRNPAAGHCQVGSLTGAVASNWGSPAATLEASSGCLLGHPSPRSWNRNPLPIQDLRSEASGATHPRKREVKMRPVRIISREVFVTPQRLYAGHPIGMMRQSELPSDRKLRVSAPSDFESRDRSDAVQGAAA